MVYCSKYGKLNEDYSKYCFNCGNKLIKKEYEEKTIDWISDAYEKKSKRVQVDGFVNEELAKKFEDLAFEKFGPKMDIRVKLLQKL